MSGKSTPIPDIEKNKPGVNRSGNIYTKMIKETPLSPQQEPMPEKQISEPISRREMLEKTLALLAITTTIGFPGQKMLDELAKRYPEGLGELVQRIYRRRELDVLDEEGNTHHLILFFHQVGPVPGEQLKPESLNPNAQALILETANLPYLRKERGDQGPTHGEAVGLVKKYLNAPKDSHHEIVVQTLNEGKPVVFCDLAFPENILTLLVEYGPEAVASLGGLSALYASLKQKSITRRQLFKLVGATALSWGASKTLIGHPIVWADALFSEEWTQKLAKLDHTIEKTHPESLILGLRNQVLAVKLTDLDLNTNVTIGKAHLPLPIYVEEGKKTLLARLKLYPRWYLKRVCLDPRQLYTSVVVEKDQEGNFKTREIEHPDLKEIFG